MSRWWRFLHVGLWSVPLFHQIRTQAELWYHSKIRKHVVNINTMLWCGCGLCFAMLYLNWHYWVDPSCNIWNIWKIWHLNFYVLSSSQFCCTPWPGPSVRIQSVVPSSLLFLQPCWKHCIDVDFSDKYYRKVYYFSHLKRL